MYLAHWEMKRRPFDCNHAPRMFVPVESMMVALTKLRYALCTSMAAVAVTGAAGVGKTELVRMALEELDHSGWRTVYVPTAGISPERLLSLLGSCLGASESLPPLDRLLLRLQKLLENGVRVCLAFDEMHTVRNDELWDVLRMLMNVEAHGRQAVSLVMAGQTPLTASIDATPAIASRLTLRVRLAALSREETSQYVLYRLKAAGCNRGIFTRQAADAIFAFSLGVPARINRICDLALLSAFGSGSDKVGPEMIQMAAQELGLADPLSGRTGHRATAPAADDEGDILANLDAAPADGFDAPDASDDVLANL